MYNGEFRIYQRGKLLTTQKNLITNSGRQAITRYLAGQTQSFSGAIAIGSSDVPASVADTSLGFEFSRAPIHLKTSDVTTGEIVLSASLDAPIGGSVFELGVFPYVLALDASAVGGIIIRFEEFEGWTGGTYNLSRTRVGSSSYQLTAAVSSTARANSRNSAFGIHDLAANDTFSMAYFINDANTDVITIEFHSTAVDYFRYTFDPSATAGYYITTWPKSAFMTVGSPAWETVDYVDIVVGATALGSTTVQLDGLRINSAVAAVDNLIVSRSVRSPAQIKSPSTPLDVEYVLRYANG